MPRRKKSSAKSSLDGKALALKPPSIVRLYEIIEEVVDHLRPWKGRKDSGAITAAVDHELGFMLILAPLEAKRSDRTRNRTHALELDGALHNVELLLASAPSPLQSFLLNPQPTMTDEGVLVQAGTPPMEEEITRANRERQVSFAAELKRLRKVCARAIDPGLGYHPNYDRPKHFCAKFAYGLMRELSHRTITGTEDYAFRAIASLLYEAISGQRDVDLKRACDTTLRDNRGSD